MASILLFAVVLMIAGGGIAFIGDRLGTWVGKKRLSKFGLRPKHTAMLYTTITGGLIAVLTLGLLLLVETEVRRAITEGRQLFAQIRTYKKDIRDLRQKNDAARIETANAEAEAASAKAAAVSANSVAQLANDKAAKAHAKLAEEQKLYNERIALDRRQLDAAENQLHDARSNLDIARSNLTVAQQQLVQAKGEGKLALENLRRAELRVAAAEKTVAAREADVARLNKQHKTLVAENDNLLKRNLDLESHTNIYYTGDEVGRTVIDTSLSPSDIRDRLTGWLNALSQTAGRRGAGTGSNGRDIVVQGDGSEGPAESNPEDASLDTLADHIAQQAGIVSSVIVVASARFNTTHGEQVRLDLHPYDNILVFSKGETVAQATINGGQPQDKVLSQLMAFVSQKVKPVAREKSIMPTVDPGTQATSYGEIETPLLDTVAKIQAAGPGAQVVAVTADDVFTQGPLKVRLQVVPSPSSAADGAHPSAGTSGQTPDTVRLPQPVSAGHSDIGNNLSPVAGL